MKYPSELSIYSFYLILLTVLYFAFQIVLVPMDEVMDYVLLVFIYSPALYYLYKTLPEDKH